MLRKVRSSVTLAEVAATCGYADQSHLTRDFTTFAGCSPTSDYATRSFQFSKTTARRPCEDGPTADEWTTRMTTSPAIWPVLTFRDAPAAIEFLEKAFGFVRVVVHTRDDDPTIVEHAEMRWPLGGGVMFGSAGKDNSPFGQRQPGTDLVYVVCDDPDALLERAVGAGANIVRELADEDYGSRDFTVRDPEGNLWSFGTYAGAA